MKFSELIGKSNEQLSPFAGEDFEVAGLAYDSRKVKPGYVFFAIKGLKDDGTKYVKDAIQSGACAVISSAEGSADEQGKTVLTANVRRTMASMSNTLYGNPSSKLGLIGITGTNGKTTTTYLTKSILEYGGRTCGLIGTINYEYGKVKGGASLTTPDSVELNMLLGEMVSAGMKFCAMEVSSIALVMERVYGLRFSTALFTNLTSEHLDFHGNMDEYFKAKKILFDGLTRDSHAISNCDDEYGLKILDSTSANKFLYSIKNQSDLKPKNVDVSVKGIRFELEYKREKVAVESRLTGGFNVYNLLGAISICLNNGISLATAADAVRDFEAVRGRFNRVSLPNGASAVVDYSHTSDSLKNAIESARDLVNLEKKNGRVITIFGCGGNKDRTKRPVMGKLAVTLSDLAIITSDNPRYEDPYLIIDEIVKGTNGKKNYEIIEDREKAIIRGIELSKEGDIVLICGKGHEDYQEVKGVRRHFDDLEMVAKYSNLAGSK
jgi:UDP-N-acetylmuramoyl-L-alanyl-D-glutamate--2,6-diaminopimelate ligase